MADETTASAGGQDGGSAGIDSGFTIHTQYIKDLSVENPNAPHIFMEMKEAPAVTVNLDVTASRLQENTYEVVLNANVRATVQDKSAFVVELTYGGVITMEGEVPADQRESLLLIEAPRYLFPVARNIIGGATRDAGYPPLLINPVDFAKLYREQKAAQQKRKEQQAAGQTGDTGADEAGGASET